MKVSFDNIFVENHYATWFCFHSLHRGPDKWIFMKNWMKQTVFDFQRYFFIVLLAVN